MPTGLCTLCRTKARLLLLLSLSMALQPRCFLQSRGGSKARRRRRRRQKERIPAAVPVQPLPLLLPLPHPPLSIGEQQCLPQTLSLPSRAELRSGGILNGAWLHAEIYLWRTWYFGVQCFSPMPGGVGNAKTRLNGFRQRLESGQTKHANLICNGTDVQKVSFWRHREGTDGVHRTPLKKITVVDALHHSALSGSHSLCYDGMYADVRPFR